MIHFTIKLGWTLLIMFAIVRVGGAEIPQTISYQGVLSDNNSQLVADGQYKLNFKLTNSPNNNVILWQETHDDVAIVNGIFNVILGSVTPLDLAFDEPYWLGISVNDGDVLLPLTELTASPYSLNASSVSDSAITSNKIASGHVVRSVNGLTDFIKLVGGHNVMVTTQADSVIISAESELTFGQDSNMQPFLAINYIIALEGTFPSRNSAQQMASSTTQGVEPFIGEVIMFGGNFAPRGWALCQGQLLPISQHQALFSILGTFYGGDGRTTFGLPDLRGRTPIQAGQGPGLSDRRLGRKGGSENINGSQ